MMRTIFDDAAVASASAIMAAARKSQGAHGAGLILAAVRKLRQVAARAMDPEVAETRSALRQH